MRISNVFALIVATSLLTATVLAAEESAPSPTPQAAAAVDLSKFIYSYGAVAKVSASEIVLQEYDYDSDVEKQVTYQLDPDVKLDGFKAISDLAVEDVVEVYYAEQDGKKIAKIIRREVIEDENASSENT